MKPVLPWVNSLKEFPSPHHALHDPNGLLAAGGELSVPWLLHAYQQGTFPWFGEGAPLLWWSPDPRGVLWAKDLSISHSLRKTLRQSRYRVFVDSNFADVIRACAQPRAYTAETWISPAMQQAYIDLHAAGYAHSLEVINEQGQLVGGIYGVCLGRMFFGESMFSRVPNASKIALVFLVRRLEQAGCKLIDTQLPNPHLQSLGGSLLPRHEFLRHVHTAMQQPLDMAWSGELHWSELNA
ncbi:MAG: leucyl/phenylalanyl-tRNA--protein transferase [Pseudomonadales bacterium]|nr:leucyl/phenylalanyl-tRNA--protein transferase [Pseudomonadales bacterium]